MSSRSYHLVDAQIRPLLEVFPTVDLTDESLATARATAFPFAPASPEAVTAVAQDRRMIPGRLGAPDVPVDIYHPGGSDLPCIFHVHGGGFVAGRSLEQASLHQQRAFDQRCAVVSVDYRLAPETPFPGSVEDCYSALGWLMAHAEDLGIDRTRVGVLGESAGGGLAAALALLARDRGEYQLAFQHLIYPMLDDRTCTRDDPHPFAGEYIWTARSNRYGWAALLGSEPGGSDVSPYAAPARAAKLDGLPPAFIMTGSLDLFLEEDIEYARRLMRSGVACELHVFPGGVHGFDWGPEGIVVANAARHISGQALGRALHGRDI